MPVLRQTLPPGRAVLAVETPSVGLVVKMVSVDRVESLVGMVSLVVSLSEVDFSMAVVVLKSVVL